MMSVAMSMHTLIRGLLREPSDLGMLRLHWKNESISHTTQQTSVCLINYQGFMCEKVLDCIL